MTDRQPATASDASIRVGVIILATTVSAVVWHRIIIWTLARRDWLGSPGDGAQVIAAILAVAVTWIIWGRVNYWLHAPDDVLPT
jgi:hypothetical protein